MKNGRMFEWNMDELEIAIKETVNDRAVALSVQEIKKQQKRLGRPPRVLEAGCGNGRVVVYLNRIGIPNVCGIELNQDAVTGFNKRYPDMDVRYGDIMDLPNDLRNHDIVLSYGVVEHFLDGPLRPLRQMYNDLADDGRAVITIPFLNGHRWKQYKKSKHPEQIWDREKFPFYSFMDNGEFFEYRFTIAEFKRELKRAGFKIEKRASTGLEWGILERLNAANKPGRRIWFDYTDQQFHYTPMGKIRTRILKLFPRRYAHMQLFVCKKDI